MYVAVKVFTCLSNIVQFIDKYKAVIVTQLYKLFTIILLFYSVVGIFISCVAQALSLCSYHNYFS